MNDVQLIDMGDGSNESVSASLIGSDHENGYESNDQERKDTATEKECKKESKWMNESSRLCLLRALASVASHAHVLSLRPKVFYSRKFYLTGMDPIKWDSAFVLTCCPC